jgi:hypothetical protein
MSKHSSVKTITNKHSRTAKVLSSEFSAFRPDVYEYIEKRIPEKPSVIFDPMSGTAPFIPFVEKHGHTAYFNDIVPLHYYINSAKTYAAFEMFSKQGYDWFSSELLKCMFHLQGKRLCISDKEIDDQILKGLIASWQEFEKYDPDIKIILEAVMLLCVRPLSCVTKTTNPTWLKSGGISSNKDLSEIISDSLLKLRHYYSYWYSKEEISIKGKCFFSIGDGAIFEAPQKADLIITSPPYCNRLDYNAQYRPENYFLSEVGHVIHNSGIVGTTIVKDYSTFETDFEFLTNNSKYANKLLNKIKNYPKDDALSYYIKYYTRYFAMVYHTIETALNNMNLDGKMYVVLQDNTHRGQVIEIDSVIKELLKPNGWQLKTVKKWERHHLGLQNVSKGHAFIKQKQFEKLVVIQQ